MSKREIYRILDAAANRGREALRVIEDAVRFLDDSERLATLLKSARHQFAATANKLDLHERMLARDTLGDVGTRIETQDEYRRSTLLEALIANFARLEEAARSLEEFSKIVEPQLAREWEQIRYNAYSLEKEVYEAGRERLLRRAAESEDTPTTRSPEMTRAPEATSAPTTDDEPAPCAHDDALKEEAEKCVKEEEAQEEIREPSEEADAEPESDDPPRTTQRAPKRDLSGLSLRKARRAKLREAVLCCYVDRKLPTTELHDLLSSSADIFELSFDSDFESETFEQTEGFLRQWFNKYPDATSNLNDRPLLLTRDSGFWGDVLDGWVVPIDSVVRARNAIGRDALLGVIVSSLRDTLAALQAWSAGYVDFIEVGPIFADQGAISRTGLSIFRSLFEHFEGAAPPPIFAFGGINEQNCRQVLMSGIKRLGLGEAILTAPDKRAAVASFKSFL